MAKIGDRRTDNRGYTVVKVGPSEWAGEHRLQMEATLGRPLVDGEFVHHRNGDRADNRPENLELWTQRPKGCRVDDLTQWAVEHLRKHAPNQLAETQRNAEIVRRKSPD